MAAGMNVLIYVVVFLAAVSKVSLSLPSQSPMTENRFDGAALVSGDRSYNHTRQARSAGTLPSAQQSKYNQSPEDAEALNTLSQLLVRLISRKGMLYQSRSSIASRASGLAAEHRIKDRDYEGWMDFGRRSAEAMEVS
ncbi:cholecystokinin-like [Hippocampus zosterae]|uniref:cholecystokinin-like n=1 Tax=Hippocampus zosterae TaxID=109293 RepID=UPI00223E0B5C|nr:cholecystokinin-like [Hippocampus zosterae]